MSEQRVQRNSLYDGTATPGVSLMHQIIQTLAQAQLIRKSPYTGGEIRGLVPNDQIGLLGYCVHDNGETWTIDIVLSGKKCGVNYSSWEERESDQIGFITLHRPVDPERLYEPIIQVFTTFGFSVQHVRTVGYQMHWDDDITYQVVVQAPQI